MFQNLDILIVDDIFINRMLLVEIIENLGAKYSEATNGKEAVDLMQIKKFDIVFLDIEMPVMNGFETARYIRSKMPKPISEIPIIAITAYNINDLDKNFTESGFTTILLKPYTLERIEKILNDFF
jgi:CheY-like chemotaxis protein